MNVATKKFKETGGFDTSRLIGTTQPPFRQLRLSSVPSKTRNVSRQPDDSEIKLGNLSAK